MNRERGKAPSGYFLGKCMKGLKPLRTPKKKNVWASYATGITIIYFFRMLVTLFENTLEKE